ncbi:hypothetical protein N0V93_006468 [Gnomoniopsis smithogilvyi]|uniref:Uncharacterized protein n=1 Tax=Gnomoniopsis smithogilvyi TaxID=1191159 RepID=A0A9W8YQU2_9PEZI|nr:hypothetical protein N0V93_006468 [Gnomoniopsis smithogilvyi]
MKHYSGKHEPLRVYYECPLCPTPLTKRFSTLGIFKPHVDRHFADDDGTKEQKSIAYDICDGTIGPKKWEWDPASRLWPESRLLINWEALEVARGVLRTNFQPVLDLCAPLRHLSKSRYHKLLSWPMDVLYYDRDLTHPSLDSLKLAPYAQKIQTLAIDLELGPGDDPSLAGKVYSLFATITSLRTLYIVVGTPSIAAELRLGEFHLHQHTLQQLPCKDPEVFPWCSLRDFRGQYDGVRDTTSLQKGSDWKGPPTLAAVNDGAIAAGMTDVWLGLARDLGRLTRGTGRRGKVSIRWVSEMKVVEGERVVGL